MERFGTLPEALDSLVLVDGVVIAEGSINWVGARETLNTPLSGWLSVPPENRQTPSHKSEMWVRGDGAVVLLEDDRLLINGDKELVDSILRVLSGTREGFLSSANLLSTAYRSLGAGWRTWAQRTEAGAVAECYPVNQPFVPPAWDGCLGVVQSLKGGDSTAVEVEWVVRFVGETEAEAALADVRRSFTEMAQPEVSVVRVSRDGNLIGVLVSIEHGTEVWLSNSLALDIGSLVYSTAPIPTPTPTATPTPTPLPTPTVPPDARRGEVLFLSAGCGGCHALDSVLGASGEMGPALNAIASQGEDFIRESIVDPDSIGHDRPPGFSPEPKPDLV